VPPLARQLGLDSVVHHSFSSVSYV